MPEPEVKEVDAILENAQNDPNVDPEYPLGANGPSRTKLEKWKDQFGKLFWTILGNGEIYILRKMARKEYRTLAKEQKSAALELQKIEDPLQKQDRADEMDMDQEERVAARFLLFPALTQDDLSNGDAGVPGALAEMIFQISGFNAMVNPQPVV